MHEYSTEYCNQIFFVKTGTAYDPQQAMVHANEGWATLSKEEIDKYKEDAVAVKILPFDDLPVENQRQKIKQTRKKIDDLVLSLFHIILTATCWKSMQNSSAETLRYSIIFFILFLLRHAVFPEKRAKIVGRNVSVREDNI